MRDQSFSLRLGVASAVALVLLVPFALIAILIVGDWAPLHDFDRAVSEALHGFALDHRGWVRAMEIWSFAFDPNTWRVAALVLAGWLYRRGARMLAAWVVITMAVG